LPRQAPDLKGDTALDEFGVAFTPSRTLPLTLDFNLQGYAGQRDGISGGVKVEYRF
jgi:hypothetical protein